MSTEAKKLTRLEGAVLAAPMTLKQAKAFGQRHMPRDLRATGFKVEVYTATHEVNCWDGFNISFGKRVQA